MDTNIKKELYDYLRVFLFPPRLSKIGFGFETLEGKVNMDLLEKPRVIFWETNYSPKDFLRVVSWNVATADNFEDILGYLRKQDADVFLLQEVGINLPGGYRDTFADLSDGLKCSGVFGTSMAFLDNSREPIIHNGEPALLGEAVLTSLPFKKESATVTKLPCLYDWVSHKAGADGRLINSARVGNRVAVSLILDYLGRNLSLSSIHTEDKTFPHRRGLHPKHLLERLAEQGVSDSIVAGDVNTLFSRFPILSHWENTDRIFTREAYNIANKNEPTIKGLPLRADNIYFRNNFSVRNFKIDTSVNCSDHYPLLIELERN